MNAAITDMQMRQRDVAALDANTRRSNKLMLKLKMMLCVMMLPLVVVGCSLTKAVCQSVREATTASGVDNAASRLADTAEWDYFTSREADRIWRKNN